jgi:hypothetical protein
MGKESNRGLPSQFSLRHSIYRDNARKLQKAIAKANGLSIAADLIEQSLGVTEQAAKEKGAELLFLSK